MDYIYNSNGSDSARYKPRDGRSVSSSSLEAYRTPSIATSINSPVDVHQRKRLLLDEEIEESDSKQKQYIDEGTQLREYMCSFRELMDDLKQNVTNVKKQQIFARVVESTFKLMHHAPESNLDDKRIATTFVTNGGTSLLAQALTYFHESVVAQEQVVRLVKRVAFLLIPKYNEQLQGREDIFTKSFAAMNGISRLIDILCTHEFVPDLVAEACGALCYVARPAESRRFIADNGGAKLILQVMKNHSHIPKVQHEACGALLNLGFRDDDNKVLIAQLGGVELILRCMKMHKKHSKVQEEACGALKHLAFMTDNKSVIRELGGIELIIAAMDNHPYHAGTQEWACAVLWNLTVEDSNKALVTQLDGIQAVVRAMNNHPTHAGVQEEACGTLKNLASMSEFQTRVIQHGAIEAVIQVFKNLPENPDVLRWACAALWNIGLCQQGKVDVCRLGGIEAIVRAMDRHMDHYELQNHACGALWSLACARVENQTEIIRVGGIEALVKSMKTHYNRHDIQEQACGAFSNLCGGFFNPRVETQNHLCQVGGLDAIVSAMEAFPNHSGVQERASAALRNGVYRNAEACERLAQRGGLELLLKASKKYVNSNTLRYAEGIILFAFFGDSTNREHAHRLVAAMPESGSRVSFNGILEHLSPSGANLLARLLSRSPDITSVSIADNDFAHEQAFSNLLKLLEIHPSLLSFDISGNHLQPHHQEQLKQYLSNNYTTLSLNLSRTKLDLQNNKELLRTICNRSVLTSLNLSECRLGTAGAEALAETLANKDCSLVDVNLSHCFIRNEGCVPLGKALTQNTSVARLSLAHNKISKSGMSALARAFQVNRTLVSLDLSKNRFYKDGTLSVLVDTLSANPNCGMTQLNVSASRLHSEEAIRLFSAVAKPNFPIVKLNVSRNALEEGVFAALAEALKSSKNLHHLNLSKCQIKDAPGSVLLASIGVNQSLKALNLSGNELQSKSAVMLGRVLQQNGTLTDINLSCNQSLFTGECGWEIFEGLEKNNGLLNLNLSKLNLSSRHASALGAATAVHRTLQSLDLSGQGQYDPDTQKQLVSYLTSSPSLVRLNLPFVLANDQATPGFSKNLLLRTLQGPAPCPHFESVVSRNDTVSRVTTFLMGNARQDSAIHKSFFANGMFDRYLLREVLGFYGNRNSAAN